MTTDGTKDPKDTSGKTQDPSAGTKGTSTDTQTYTKESEEKAVSDALSAAGRDAKSITDKTAEAERILTAAQKLQTDTQVAQEEWQKERDEADREALKADPEALKSHDERVRQRNEATKLAKERTELDGEKTKHQETIASDLETIRVFNRTKLAAEVAVAKGVEIDALLKLTKEDTLEAMEATAELLPKKGEGKPPLKLDPSKTTGGGDYVYDPKDPSATLTKGFRQLKK